MSHKTRQETLVIRLLHAVPRATLEDWLGQDARPWHMDRKDLEARVTHSRTFEELKAEILDWVTSVLQPEKSA